MHGGSSKVSPEIQIQPPENYNGSKYFELPLDQAVERTLQADFTNNGLYLLDSGRELKFFRSVDVKPTNFVLDYEIIKHTPDICWINAGWTRLQTDMAEWKLELNDKEILFHRRMYLQGNHAELCYFVFLVEGNNHRNWDHALFEQQPKLNTVKNFFNKLKWTVFELRTALGEVIPKAQHTMSNAQLLRVSTDANNNVIEADKTIQKFLRDYFKQIDYID